MKKTLNSKLQFLTLNTLTGARVELGDRYLLADQLRPRSWEDVSDKDDGSAKRF